MSGNNLQDIELKLMENYRVAPGIIGYVISFIAVTMSLFHIYTATFGVFTSMLQRSVHLGLGLVLAFFILKPHSKVKNESIRWYDYVLILLTVATFGYIILNAEDITSRMTFVDPLSNIDILVGVIGALLIMEAVRRAVGWTLTIIIAVALAYTFWGASLPGILGHREFDIYWVVEQLFFTTNGVFGIPVQVSATFIFMFILFGKFLEATGAGQFFIDITVSIVGKYRGGPAKTAAVSSGLLGMLSGSAVANVTTTGSFSIPLMKKMGYPRSFAGGVEAVASSGGQIMPPLMGATAFVMAATMGVPYVEIAIAAIIPAILYYISLFLQIDFRSARLGLVGVPKEELADPKKILKKGFLFLTPLVIIIYMLLVGYSPMRAALFGILGTIIVGVIKLNREAGLKQLMAVLDVGARAAVQTCIACGAAGMLVGLISLTGIGLNFSSLIISWSGGSLFLALVFTMIGSLILGMGLPAVAAYIIQAALIVPALLDLGVEPLAAHMFILYFAGMSNVTPPIALAAFAGAGIAGADPMKTGFVAVRLAIAGFIIPFMFIYAPSMLLLGSPLEIIITSVCAMIGIYGLASGVEGWLKRQMDLWERILIIICACLLIFAKVLTGIIGVAGMVFIYLLHRRDKVAITKQQTHKLEDA